MTESLWIEHKLLTRAVEATDTEGHDVKLPELLREAKQVFPAVEDGDIVDACKRLFPKFLSLRKYDDALRDFRDYRGDHDDAVFFSYRRFPS